MKKWFGLENKKRKGVSKKEYMKSVLKSLMCNNGIKEGVRWQGMISLSSCKASKVSLVKRCVTTLRSRSTMKKLRLNRLEVFRKLKVGDLPGYRSLSKK